MTRIEYKVDFLPFNEHEETHRAEMLAKLNELGKDGWRLIAIDPFHRGGGGWTTATPTPLLLMREVTA